MRNVFVIGVLTLSWPMMWAADWLTDGHDPQRTGWQRDETILTTSNVANLKLLWKIKTGNEPRQMHNLFPPLIVQRVNTPNGPKEMALLAGVSDNLYGIDVASGQIVWKKHFDSENLTGSGGILCPGGQTATPVVAPTATPGKYTIYAVSWQGQLHQLNLADGEDIAPPALFMPSNGKPYALNLFNGVIYTMTGNNCGGLANFVYAYDLATNRASIFSGGSGGMWGSRGPAIGADGTVYTGTGDGVFDPRNGLYGDGIVGVKQNPRTKTLELGKYFGPSNAEYLYKRDLDVNTTPTILTFTGKEYLVGSSKECKLWLLDTSNFGGEDHRTPVYRTPLICNEFSNYFSHGVWGALSNWVDSKGTQWVLTPFWGPQHSEFKAPLEYGPVVHGAVAAFRLEEVNGKPQLTPAWVSRDMNQADPPVIANGIVFGYGSGENSDLGHDDVPAGQTAKIPSRIDASTHAILYALDGQTGKELWSSGDQIASFNHQTGLTVANGRVYIGTYDGIEYCFGLGN